jgi:hypothetical protein
MRKNYTIAICDILGFKDLVQKNPLAHVIKGAVLGFVRRALYHSIHQEDPPNDSISLEQLRNDARLDLAWYSDSILLYTRDDTEECLGRLLSAIGWLLFFTTFSSGTHFRCGIAYGEMYIDPKESVYVGKPLIEAHNLEKSQVWSGGALTSTARDRVPRSWVEYPCDYFLVNYAVPCKAVTNSDKLLIERREMFAIDWTRGLHLPRAYIHWSKNKSKPSPDEWKTMPDICEKWMNVNRFHIEVCSRCKSEDSIEEWRGVEEELRHLENLFVEKKQKYGFFHE